MKMSTYIEYEVWGKAYWRKRLQILRPNYWKYKIVINLSRFLQFSRPLNLHNQATLVSELSCKGSSDIFWSKVTDS